MTKCPLDPAVAAVRGARIGVEDAALTQLQAVLAWTEAHRVDQVEDADTYRTSAGILGSIDSGILLAGEGAPMVEEFACHDLACAMARTPDSAQAYVGDVLELVHRLPALWMQVQRRKIAVGKAMRMAEQTILLSGEAVAFVDTQIAWCAGTITWAQLERTVAEAVARFDPARAEREAAEAAERRRFDIDLDQRGVSGLAEVQGVLDVEDALDLEAAIATRARHLGELGCEGSLDVRRAKAAGEVARHALGQDTLPDTPDEANDRATVPMPSPVVETAPGRSVVIYLHLHEWAIAGTEVELDPVATLGSSGGREIGVLLGHVQALCAEATRVVIKPVTDLVTCRPADAYDIPAATAEQVDLRDRHCVFPYCTRPARRCDHDHNVPWPAGVTCPCNLAALCRRHHRAKTHDPRFHYDVIVPGTYRWTLPSGQQFTVDPDGTHDLTRDVATTSTPSVAGEPPGR